MPEPKIYAGQWGHTHTITFKERDENGDLVIVDISTASEVQIVFRRRNQTEIVVAATLVTDGTDGQARYKVAENDTVDVLPGEWRRWGKVITPDGEWPSTPERYTVYTPGDE